MALVTPSSVQMVRARSSDEMIPASLVSTSSQRRSGICRQYRLLAPIYSFCFVVAACAVIGIGKPGTVTWISVALAVMALASACWSGCEIKYIPDLRNFKNDVDLLNRTAAKQVIAATEIRQGVKELIEDGKEEEQQRLALTSATEDFRKQSRDLGRTELDLHQTVNALGQDISGLRDETSAMKRENKGHKELIEMSKDHIKIVQKTIKQASAADRVLEAHARQLDQMLQEMDHLDLDKHTAQLTQALQVCQESINHLIAQLDQEKALRMQAGESEAVFQAKQAKLKELNDQEKELLARIEALQNHQGGAQGQDQMSSVQKTAQMFTAALDRAGVLKENVLNFLQSDASAAAPPDEARHPLEEV